MRSAALVAFAVIVAAANGYANAHHLEWGDWLATALFVTYAAYCAWNFAQCREVHCAITAPGFFLAALLMIFRLAGVAHYAYGVPWYVFTASAGIGFCLQWLYRRQKGSGFLSG